MASSLQSQLTALQHRPAHDKHLRHSFLFDDADAKQLSREEIHQVALAGLRVLVGIDNRFDAFAATLFSASIVRRERAMYTNAEAAQLTAALAQFLALLGPHFLLTAAHQCVEFLLRVYEAHTFHAGQLIDAFLPFHDHALFARLVATLDLRGTGFEFLAKNQERGGVLPRRVLITASAENKAVLEAVCRTVTNAIRFKVANNGAFALWVGVATGLSHHADADGAFRVLLPHLVDLTNVPLLISVGEATPAVARGALSAALMTLCAWAAEVELSTKVLTAAVKPLVALLTSTSVGGDGDDEDEADDEDKAERVEQLGDMREDAGEGAATQRSRGAFDISRLVPIADIIAALAHILARQPAACADPAFGATLRALVELPWAAWVGKGLFSPASDARRGERLHPMMSALLRSATASATHREASRRFLRVALEAFPFFTREDIMVVAIVAVRACAVPASTSASHTPPAVRTELEQLLRVCERHHSLSLDYAVAALMEQPALADATGSHAEVRASVEGGASGLAEMAAAANVGASVAQIRDFVAAHVAGAKYLLVDVSESSNNSAPGATRAAQRGSGSGPLSLPLVSCLMHHVPQIRAHGLRFLASEVASHRGSHPFVNPVSGRPSSLLELFCHLLASEHDVAAAERGVEVALAAVPALVAGLDAADEEGATAHHYQRLVAPADVEQTVRAVLEALAALVASVAPSGADAIAAGVIRVVAAIRKAALGLTGKFMGDDEEGGGVASRVEAVCVCFFAVIAAAAEQRINNDPVLMAAVRKEKTTFFPQCANSSTGDDANDTPVLSCLLRCNTSPAQPRRKAGGATTADAARCIALARAAAVDLPLRLHGCSIERAGSTAAAVLNRSFVSVAATAVVAAAAVAASSPSAAPKEGTAALEMLRGLEANVSKWISAIRHTAIEQLEAQRQQRDGGSRANNETDAHAIALRDDAVAVVREVLSAALPALSANSGGDEDPLEVRVTAVRIACLVGAPIAPPRTLSDVAVLWRVLDSEQPRNSLEVELEFEEVHRQLFEVPFPADLRVGGDGDHDEKDEGRARLVEAQASLVIALPLFAPSAILRGKAISALRKAFASGGPAALGAAPTAQHQSKFQKRKKPDDDDDADSSSDGGGGGGEVDMNATISAGTKGRALLHTSTSTKPTVLPLGPALAASLDADRRTALDELIAVVVGQLASGGAANSATPAGAHISAAATATLLRVWAAGSPHVVPMRCQARLLAVVAEQCEAATRSGGPLPASKRGAIAAAVVSSATFTALARHATFGGPDARTPLTAHDAALGAALLRLIAAGSHVVDHVAPRKAVAPQAGAPNVVAKLWTFVIGALRAGFAGPANEPLHPAAMRAVAGACSSAGRSDAAAGPKLGAPHLAEVLDALIALHARGIADVADVYLTRLTPFSISAFAALVQRVADSVNTGGDALSASVDVLVEVFAAVRRGNGGAAHAPNGDELLEPSAGQISAIFGTMVGMLERVTSDAAAAEEGAPDQRRAALARQALAALTHCVALAIPSALGTEASAEDALAQVVGGGGGAFAAVLRAVEVFCLPDVVINETKRHSTTKDDVRSGVVPPSAIFGDVVRFVATTAEAVQVVGSPDLTRRMLRHALRVLSGVLLSPSANFAGSGIASAPTPQRRDATTGRLVATTYPGVAVIDAVRRLLAAIMPLLSRAAATGSAAPMRTHASSAALVNSGRSATIVHIPVLAMLIRLDEVSAGGVDDAGRSMSTLVHEVLFGALGDVGGDSACAALMVTTLTDLLRCAQDPDAHLVELSRAIAGRGDDGGDAKDDEDGAAMLSMFRSIIKTGKVANRQLQIFTFITEALKDARFLNGFVSMQRRGQGKQQQQQQQQRGQAMRRGGAGDDDADDGEYNDRCAALLVAVLNAFATFHQRRLQCCGNPDGAAVGGASEGHRRVVTLENVEDDEQEEALLLELVAGNALACVLSAINEPTFASCAAALLEYADDADSGLRGSGGKKKDKHTSKKKGQRQQQREEGSGDEEIDEDDAENAGQTFTLDAFADDTRKSVQKKALQLLLDRLHRSCPTAEDERAELAAQEQHAVVDLADDVDSNPHRLQVRTRAIRAGGSAALRMLRPRTTRATAAALLPPLLAILKIEGARPNARNAHKLQLCTACIEEIVRAVGSRQVSSVARRAAIAKMRQLGLVEAPADEDDEAGNARLQAELSAIAALTGGRRRGVNTLHQIFASLVRLARHLLPAAGAASPNATSCLVVGAVLNALATMSTTLGVRFMLDSSVVIGVSAYEGRASREPHGIALLDVLDRALHAGTLSRDARNSAWLRRCAVTALRSVLPQVWTLAQPHLPSLLRSLTHNLYSSSDDAARGGGGAAAAEDSEAAFEPLQAVAADVLQDLAALIEARILVECVCDSITAALAETPTPTTAVPALLGEEKFGINARSHSLTTLYGFLRQLLANLNAKALHKHFPRLLAEQGAFWIQSFQMLSVGAASNSTSSDDLEAVFSCFFEMLIKFKEDRARAVVSSLLNAMCPKRTAGASGAGAATRGGGGSSSSERDEEEGGEDDDNDDDGPPSAARRRAESGGGGGVGSKGARPLSKRQQAATSATAGGPLLLAAELRSWITAVMLCGYCVKRLETLALFLFPVLTPVVVDALATYGGGSLRHKGTSEREDELSALMRALSPAERVLVTRLLTVTLQLVEGMSVAAGADAEASIAEALPTTAYFAQPDTFAAVMPVLVRQVHNVALLHDSSLSFEERAEAHLIPAVRAFFKSLLSPKMWSRTQSELLRGLQAAGASVRRITLAALRGIYADGGDQLAALIMAEALPAIVEATEDSSDAVVEEARLLCNELSSISGQDVLHAMSS